MEDHAVIKVEKCPLCGGGQSNLFDQRAVKTGDSASVETDRRLVSTGSIKVTNRLCGGCGLVYQSPRMADNELQQFYEQEYRLLYQGSEGPTPKDLAVQQGRAKALLKFARPRLPQAEGALMRHLDIGCSAGLLLQEFQAAYHYQPMGIEPGDAYRNYAAQKGLQVVASLEELPVGLKFNLISLAHVLEHLAEPLDYLQTLRQEWLNPSGYLLLEVPNLYAHDSFEIAHLVSYSPHTLQQTLQQAGYEILAFQTHGQPRSAILPLYLTALAKPAERPFSRIVRPERAVRLKRRLGLARRRLLTRLAPRQAWLPVK